MLASTLLLSMAIAKPIAPDPRGMAGPDRNFDLQTLHLDLTLVPEEERVFGAARLGVERLFEGPLVLHQVALNIDSVQTDGKKLDWRTQGELLIVEGVGQRAEVEIQYSATPRAGLHFRGGEGTTDTYPEVWSQGENEYNRHWFPSWDYPNDRFVYTGDIKGPEGWKILTNSGVDMVNYLVMVAAAPYDVYGSGLNEVWVAPGTPKEQADAVMEYIPAMHTHFTDRTGVAYPWKNYRQIFVQRFIYGGMENTTATIMNDRYLRTSMFPETNNGPQDVIAHELAHQWYGDLLTCRSWRELWLNEGFATFMASDWHTSILGAEHDAQRVRSWFKSSSRPYTLAGRFHQGEGDVGHGVYVKGASVLQMLRGMLGEEIFWKGVQRYTQNHLNQLVETRDLQRAFEDVSGRNLGWFFQQWVELPHVPELSVRWQHRKGVLDVTVKQSGGKEQPMYTLPIEIEVGSQKGVSYHKSWIDDRSTRISIPMEKAPDYVAFDPKRAILAKVTYEQGASEWKAQLQSPSAHARLDAIYGLKEAKGAAELGAVLVDVTKHAVLRSTAAKQLGEMGEGALIMEGLKDPHAAVRKASIQALEKTTYKESIPTLLGLHKKDPNPDVRARVLDTLAALEPKKALELAKKEVKSKKFRPAMLYSMLGVFRSLGVLSDIPNILEYGKKHGVRGSVLWSLTTILNREELGIKRSKMRERIARYTEDLLYDQNQRVREAAIRILREVGDDRSIAHLKTLIQTENLSSFHESARSSIKEIRSRDDSISSKTPNEKAARLKEIEERLENLEKDYKKLIEKY